MLQDNINLFNSISEYYSPEIFDRLDPIKEKIKLALEELLNEKAKNYSLTSSNSVSSSTYVSVKGRVKSKDSFREKLIRKNLGLRLIKELNLSQTNFDAKKGEIEGIVEQFDDIIGLRMVCDLSKDCNESMELIKDNLTFLSKRKIEFIPNELENQPQIMKNGLSIFRLKGKYSGRYGFELQIKSKIDEAWGELDHFLFYKDYGFYPSKGIVQKTMNNVGHLLEEIEHLLYDLRNSKKDYEINYNNSLLFEKLEERFSKTLTDQFHFNYQLDRIANILDELINKYYPNFVEESEPITLEFNFLSFNCIFRSK